jgi:hypothetical protein
VLTEQQRHDLATTGIARIPGVLDRDTVTAIEDRCWMQLERRGISRSDPSTWPSGFTTKNQGMRHAGLFDPFDTAVTRGIVDDLLGPEAWTAPTSWGQALLSFPQPGPWEVTSRVWHLDFPGRGDPDVLPAARLFGFVVDVGPEGGGTLVVEGSHELVRRMLVERGDAGASRDIRKRLAARYGWFRTLLRDGDPDERRRTLMEDGDELDGVRVRVRELTGAAGDVVIQLPWTLHAISRHAGDRVRIIANHTTTRRGSTIYAPSAATR